MTDEVRRVPWAGIPFAGEMLKPAEAAARLNYSRSRYYELAKLGFVPTPVKIGEGYNGASAVPLSWIEAVLEDRFRRAAA